MIVWRIANEKHADLSGQGGLYGPGRWHTQGKPIVYAAEHPALAMLEMRVHMNVDARLLANYVLLKIDTGDCAMADHAGIDFQTIETQQFGDQWLAERQTPLLRVPSIVMPESFNILMNPAHPDAGSIELVETRHFDVDRRLFL